MVVKTNISRKELRKIISNYEIGKFVDSRPFKQGNVQTNILIETDQGRYVLRVYENRTRESVLFETDYLNYLRKNKYPCPQPIRDSKSRFIRSYKNRPYVLFSYIQGKQLRNLNSHQLEDLIKHLAVLHNLSENYRPKNYRVREPRTKAFCLEVAVKQSKRFSNIDQGKFRLEIIRSKLNKVVLPRTLPKGIIHGDFDKANIRFKEDEVSGVLDFDDVCYTYFIYDIGVVLLYWARFYTRKFDFNNARKIMQVYAKYRLLSQAEKRHIFDAINLATVTIMAFLLFDKWKGRDLFRELKRISSELDCMGREGFYRRIFK